MKQQNNQNRRRNKKIMTSQKYPKTISYCTKDPKTKTLQRYGILVNTPEEEEAFYQNYTDKNQKIGIVSEFEIIAGETN